MSGRGSINKVILIGHLGDNPELRYTPSGDAVANFRVATNRTWKDREGNPQEKTEWHRVVAWRKRAEICSQYLKKGSHIYVEGRLETRTWEDQTGNKRYSTEIVIDNMQMLDARGESEVRSAPAAPPSSGVMDNPPEEDVPF